MDRTPRLDSSSCIHKIKPFSKLSLILSLCARLMVDAGGQETAAALPVAWHPRRHWLAAADSEGLVHVLDYELPSKAAPGSEPVPPQPRALLQHALQTKVSKFSIPEPEALLIIASCSPPTHLANPEQGNFCGKGSTCAVQAGG